MSRTKTVTVVKLLNFQTVQFSNYSISKPEYYYKHNNKNVLRHNKMSLPIALPLTYDFRYEGGSFVKAKVHLSDVFLIKWNVKK